MPRIEEGDALRPRQVSVVERAAHDEDVAEDDEREKPNWEVAFEAWMTGELGASHSAREGAAGRVACWQ